MAPQPSATPLCFLGSLATPSQSGRTRADCSAATAEVCMLDSGRVYRRTHRCSIPTGAVSPDSRHISIFHSASFWPADVVRHEAD
jgi:hypothetical protein